MALKLNELKTDTEFPALLAALDEAYNHPYNGFWLMFSGESKEEFAVRAAQWNKADPASHWIYVTDTSTGEIMGGTQWSIYEKNPFDHPQPPVVATWLQEGSKFRAIAEEALNGFLEGRPGRMSRPHLIIQWCGTHPSHRRRGAGLMMMGWGTAKADEMNVDCFVEATEEGEPLYRAAGFITVNEIWVDAGQDNKDEEWQAWREKLKLPMHGYWMWRPKGGKFLPGVTRYPWDVESESAAKQE